MSKQNTQGIRNIMASVTNRERKRDVDNVVYTLCKENGIEIPKEVQYIALENEAEEFVKEVEVKTSRIIDIFSFAQTFDGHKFKEVLLTIITSMKDRGDFSEKQKLITKIDGALASLEIFLENIGEIGRIENMYKNNTKTSENLEECSTKAMSDSDTDSDGECFVRVEENTNFDKSRDGECLVRVEENTNLEESITVESNEAITEEKRGRGVSKRRWTNREEVILKDMYSSGIDLKEIAKTLGRSLSSVKSKTINSSLKRKRESVAPNLTVAKRQKTADERRKNFENLSDSSSDSDSDTDSE